ncbi:MAG: hypothetical protein ABIQ93_17080, partial [Saprospiraceae bacterium]
MDNKTFDSQLKSALENLEVPLEPTAWAAFEQRFPAPAAQPADAVDQVLRRSLEQLETPYQPAHWDMLASHLSRIEQLRRRIEISKAAEVAILLLLLLLGNEYGFFGFQARHATPPAPVQQEPMANAGKYRSGKNHPFLPAGGSQDKANGFFVPLDASQRPGNAALENQAIVSETTPDPQAMAPDVAIVSVRNGLDPHALCLSFDPLSTLDYLTLPSRTLLNPLKEVTPKALLASHFYVATYASLEQN